MFIRCPPRRRRSDAYSCFPYPRCGSSMKKPLSFDGRRTGEDRRGPRRDRPLLPTARGLLATPGAPLRDDSPLCEPILIPVCRFIRRAQRLGLCAGIVRLEDPVADTLDAIPRSGSRRAPMARPRWLISITASPICQAMRRVLKVEAYRALRTASPPSPVRFSMLSSTRSRPS